MVSHDTVHSNRVSSIHGGLFVLFNEGQTWQDVPAAKLALLRAQEAIVCDVVT